MGLLCSLAGGLSFRTITVVDRHPVGFLGWWDSMWLFTISSFCLLLRRRAQILLSGN